MRYFKRVFSVMMSMLLIVQMFGGLGNPVYADGNKFAGNISLSVSGMDDSKDWGQAVLGRESEVSIQLKNESAAMAYNISIEVELPDGLELGAGVSADTVVDTTVGGEQIRTVRWVDIKNLAGGESYTFPVDIQSTNEYRAGGLVSFGEVLNPVVRVYAGDVQRELYYDQENPNAVWSESVEIVPFMLHHHEGVKNVKGAGDDTSYPNPGEEWGKVSHEIEIINNTRSITELTQFTQTIDRAVQVYDFKDESNQSVATNELVPGTIEWSMPALNPGETKRFTYKTAFFNHEYGSETNINHLQQKDVTFTYRAKVGGVLYGDGADTITKKVTSRDIVVYKSWQKMPGSSAGNDAGYDDKIEYTIRVKVNEYEPITDVVVVDELGDGQDFLSTSRPSDFVVDESGDTTILTWELGDMDYSNPATREYTFTYEVEVTEEWKGSKNSEYVVAGDILVNEVTVTGQSLSSGNGVDESVEVKDDDSTVIPISTPTIHEAITEVNGEDEIFGIPVDAVQQAVAVGDNVTFEVEYDAVNLPIKQYKVFITNYLPIGTELVGDAQDYKIGAVGADYNSSNHALEWNFGNVYLDEDQLQKLSTALEVLVLNKPETTNNKNDKNIVVLTFENSEGHIQSIRKEVKLVYVEPHLIMTREVTLSSNLHGDDEVDVKIKLKNIRNTTAYNVVLKDIVPEGIQNYKIVPEDADYQSPAPDAGDLIVFDPIDEIDPGEEVTLTYTAKLINPIGASKVITFKGAEWTYEGNTDDKKDPRTYLGEETTTTSIQAEGPTITKKMIDTSGDKTDPEDPDSWIVRPKDWVVYEVNVEVPDHNITYNPVIINDIPDRETYSEVLIDYDVNTGMGDIPDAPVVVTDKISTDQRIEISGLPSSSGAEYTYYIKTIVDRIDEGESETYKPGASFNWDDADEGAAEIKNRSISVVENKKPIVNIQAPELVIDIQPQTVHMKKGDVQAFEVVITNEGPNTAYDFTPTVTIPAGYLFGNGDYKPDQTVSPDDGSITKEFADVNDLAPNQSESYTFEVELDHVKGSGSTQVIQVSTGDYYSKDSDGEKYDYVTDKSDVVVPSVTLTNKIEATSSGELSFIRPGDTVDYEVVVKIPQGTIAYDLEMEDVFEQLGADSMFELIEYELTDKPGDFDEGPGHFAVSGNKLTANMGTVDAQTVEKQFTYLFKLRATTDVALLSPLPTPTSYTTTAVAKWNRTDDADHPEPDQTDAAKTNIDLRQPKVKIEPVPIVDSQFLVTKDKIPVSFQLTNEAVGGVVSPAFELGAEVNLPAGISVEPDSISDGGILSDDTITWTQLPEIGDASIGNNHTISFTAITDPSDPVLSPGTTGIEIDAEITGYRSNPDATYASYGSVSSDPQILSTALVTASASVVETTYEPMATFVRIGDEITYLLDVELPANTTAYNVQLNPLNMVDGQEIISVYHMDNGAVAVPIPLEHGQYDLGHIVGADTTPSAQFQVITKVIDIGAVLNPYTSTLKPELYFEDANTGGVKKQITVDPVPSQVAEPDLTIGLTSNESTFDEDTSQIMVTLSLINNGHAPAYDPLVSLTMPTGARIVPSSWIGAGDVTVVEATYLTWDSPTIGILDEQHLQFYIELEPEELVSWKDEVLFSLDEYFSLPDQHGKQYDSKSSDPLDLDVMGNHEMTPGTTKKVKAAQSAAFHHRLTNKGAGTDTFKFSIASEFPVALHIDGEKVATWDTDGHGNWQWTLNDPLANVGGQPGFTLQAGESVDMEWIVHVPESTPYDEDTDPPHQLVIMATSLLGAKDVTVHDNVIIAGDALDGWTGSQSGELGVWDEPLLAPGDPIKMSVMSSNDVTEVKAYYTSLGPTVVQPIEFEWLNQDTYIQDGEKHWKNVLTRLPDDILNGSASAQFQVTFKGWNQEGDEIQIDNPQDVSNDLRYNNYFTVKNELTISGEVTQRGTGEAIEDAKLTLYNENKNHEWVAEVNTDASGAYSFGIQPAGRYSIEVAKSGYASIGKEFFALPGNVSDSNEIVVDFELTSFQLLLDANPSTIVGDGHSESMLTATVLDEEGNPIEDVTVTFTKPQDVGHFLNANGDIIAGNNATAVTNEIGEAQVTFQSTAIEGTISQRFPITAVAEDIGRHIYASAQIIVTFEPAFISGVVTEMVDGIPVTVAGAEVIISKDFGTNAFTGRAVTGPDGTYKIAIPRGDVDYDMQINKPVMFGNGVTKYVTFEQTVRAGAITGTGHDEFIPNKGAGGMVTLQAPSGQKTVFDSADYNKMQVTLLDMNETVIGIPQILDSEGTFNFKDLPSGDYLLKIEYEIEPGEFIAINRDRDNNLPKLVITDEGELNIIEELIDPYGDITDSRTKEPIEGVTVELYYYDTTTLVPLPLLPKDSFPPADNANPHQSNADGEYAWMVFPHTDYYIRATKPGYRTHISDKISVGVDIVRYDFEMVRKASGGPILLPEKIDNDGIADVSVHLFSDRVNVGEGQDIEFTLKYRNKTDVVSKDTKITVELPEYLAVSNAAGGSVNGNTITWDLGDLSEYASDAIVFKTQVIDNNLADDEMLVYVKANMHSATELANLNDDLSHLELLLFTSNYEVGKHSLYIVGYPDGTFKPNRMITRAEIAAIFSRIMGLRDLVSGELDYPDVPTTHWASEYIEAATKAGIFSGYPDHTFKPDQAITRAELSTVIANYLKLSGEATMDLHFSDIENHWALHAIEEIYRHHIVSGYPDGTFKPNRGMIRSEAVTMINRLLHRGPLKNASQSFPDMPPTHWAFGEVEESANSHEYTRNPDGSESLELLLEEQTW